MNGDEPQPHHSFFQPNCGKKLLDQNRRYTQISDKLAEAKQFAPENPSQYLYRKIQQHQKNQLVIIKLGWRIRDLHKEEEQPALLCFNLLSNLGVFPLAIFFNEVKVGQGQGECLKSLWMEVVILCPPDSVDRFTKQKTTLEMNIFAVVEEHLLPLFRGFLQTHVCWKAMLQEGYSQKGLMGAFKEKVVKRVEVIAGHFLNANGGGSASKGSKN